MIWTQSPDGGWMIDGIPTPLDPPYSSPEACDGCLASAWLRGRLAGHLEHVRNQIEAVLELGDEDLLVAVAGRHLNEIESELADLDVGTLRDRAAEAGVEMVCRCDPAYPAPLLDLEAPPPVLHVAGGLGRLLSLLAGDPVAIVGARRASPYGLDVAHALGRGLARAGITVVSGMALGIDSAAHAGALEAGEATVAVLPGPAERPYPPRKRALHRQIVGGGAAVSELPCGATVRRWGFRARNRLIAALAKTTVVVEAGERSGSLVTARFAATLGRPVGAVPGRITTPQSAGPNELLARGAYVVRGPQDVCEEMFADGVGPRPVVDDREALTPELRRLLRAIADGRDTVLAFSRAGLSVNEGLAALASLELAGYVRRGPGGRFRVIP